tara:strand:+ start:4261 stop:5544 length:1284 start_codon:yes stop_codon:yes gene_type:complete
VSEVSKKKIAIIGSGISGLSASYILSKKYSITLFEKNDYLGGHTRTLKIDGINIDTGFIVYNDKNYLQFKSFLNHLKIKSKNSNMSFAFTNLNKDFEYSGRNLLTIFSKILRLFSFSFWRFVLEIRRFYKLCKKLDLNSLEDLTIDDFLKKNKFSESLINYHIYPLICSIWSSNSKDVKKFPLKAFISFFNNHNLFDFSNRPQWKFIENGSVSYINKILKNKKFKTLIKVKKIKIFRKKNNVIIKYDKKIASFDKVIFATNANEILKILNNPTQLEKNIFTKFKYTQNIAYLHSDINFMPKDKNLWSSWNFIYSEIKYNSFCLTYWMNLLQKIKSKKNYFVTINPFIEPKNFYDKHNFQHICFDLNMLKAQKKIKSIQGKQNTYFCGAYIGYGFHEDGIQSSIYVANLLETPLPWRNKSYIYTRLPY